MNDSEGTQGMARRASFEPAEPSELAEPGWPTFSDAPTIWDEPTTPDAPEQMAGAAHPEPLTAAQHAAPGGDGGANGQPHAQLLQDQELRSIREQWKEIQSGFVDEPTRAMQDADALVAELMQRLAQMFASEREQLEARWSGGDDVSLEELRTGLRRYHSFFERLLAA